MVKTLQQIVVVRGRTKVVLVELYIVPSVTLWAETELSLRFAQRSATQVETAVQR